MPNTSHIWPTVDDERRLLAVLYAGQATATSDLAAAFLVPLTFDLAARNPRVDPNLIDTACHEAILGFLKRPERYNPDRGNLGLFLRMAARADLKNLLQAERRHHRRRVSFEGVEDLLPDRNKLTMAEELACDWNDPQLADVVAKLPESDSVVLDLMRDGVRKTASYAAWLGLEQLDVAEQAREVKRVKDRLFKRLRRAIGSER